MRRMRCASRRAVISLTGVLVLAALLAAACGGSSDGIAGSAPDGEAVSAAPPHSGPARPYALGYQAIPASLSEAAYEAVFDLAAREGDFIMIQRTVPWLEVGADASLQPQTETTIVRETALIQERGLALLFAIDPWEPSNRARLTAGAPGHGFGDAAVTDAYVAYAELIVQRYQPRWLALAVDLDAAARLRPTDLDAFEAAYMRAYARVKDLAPETQVFVTFQLEDLQGLLPWGPAHSPQWSLILRFAPALDVLAVSSFPSFLFPFAADLPDTYYTRLAAFRKPLALVPAGYASEAGRGGVTFGTLSGQRTFLDRILAEAEAGRWELVAWLAPQDPAFATAPPFDLVGRMGLRTLSGDAKPALAVWQDHAGRPWDPPALAERVNETSALPESADALLGGEGENEGDADDSDAGGDTSGQRGG